MRGLTVAALAIGAAWTAACDDLTSFECSPSAHAAVVVRSASTTAHDVPSCIEACGGLDGLPQRCEFLGEERNAAADDPAAVDASDARARGEEDGAYASSPDAGTADSAASDALSAAGVDAGVDVEAADDGGPREDPLVLRFYYCEVVVQACLYR